MKQIEITVRLEEELKDVHKKLNESGFYIKEECDVNDIYMTSKLNELDIDNIRYILKNSVLLRSIKTEEGESKKITYKNKEYDSNGDVISEKKINIDIQNIEKAQKLFEYLNFNKLVEVKYHVVVYKKEDVEFALQIVDDLGNLIECESRNDFEGKSLDEINNVKRNMYDMLKKTGLKMTEELDVKKAYELIQKKLLKE